MNLISDLSNEIAMAILVDRKYSEEVNQNDAIILIRKVREILQPVSNTGKKEQATFFQTVKKSLNN
jgi:hypothetical protein